VVKVSKKSSSYFYTIIRQNYKVGYPKIKDISFALLYFAPENGNFGLAFGKIVMES